jgi:carbon-monoxide dehydrogenase small subunit
MTATALLERDEEITEQRVREELSGNLCRCTGYEPIVEGILAAARRRLDPSDKADD